MICIYMAGDSRGTWNLKHGPTRRDLQTVASGAVGYNNRHNARLMVAQAEELLHIAFASGAPRDALQGKTIGGGSLADLSTQEETRLESLVSAAGGGKFYALTPEGDKLLKAPVCERKNNGNT